MDLIFTNAKKEDLGVLQEYELDLAFGADENNFECKIQDVSHCCEAGSFLYFEGTEYGGIVDSIESNTESKEVIYRGRTWHGILNSKVIQPDSGKAYLTVSGEANAVIASLLTRLALTDLFEASGEDSGLTISSYNMNRYITGYDGIVKMLGTVGGKLKLTFQKGKVILAAAKRHDYTQDEEFDADQVSFDAKRNYKGVNHLICLGSGQLEERMVVHLYADKDGNISQTQTQTGLDEICAIYEYSNIESEAELIKQGIEEFESRKASDEISIDFGADSETYDVGDIIGAVDNITGLSACARIAKKIVTIKNGKITVSLSPDTAKAGSSQEVGGSPTIECVDSFNGRTGAVVPAAGDYTAGMVGAAPDGYGLGKTSSSAAPGNDLNKCLANGWYWVGSGIANMPNGITYASVFVRTRLANQIVQMLFDHLGNEGCQMIRQTKDGGTTWVEEWVNPPMSLGVEYRTTERYLGKPVYVMAINMGQLANGGVVEAAVGENPHVCVPFEATAVSPERAEIVAGFKATSSGTPGDFCLYTHNLHGRAIVGVYSKNDYSFVTAIAKVKYTKTTD